MENKRRRMLGWIAAAALTAAHALGRLPETTGILLVADHAFTVTIVLAMLALAAAVGRRVLGWLRIELPSALDTLLASVAIGLGALATILLICGALRLL